MKAVWIALFVAVPVAAAIGACSQDGSPALYRARDPGDGSADAQGSGGSGGDTPWNIDAAGGAAAICWWLGHSTSYDVGNILPAQTFCEPDAGNPPECPQEKPASGSSCSTPGSRCAYWIDATGFVLETCSEYWSEAAHPCAGNCGGGRPDVDASVILDIGCGTLPAIPCEENALVTDAERANRLLDNLAGCCGHGGETSLTLWLEDGCGVALEGPPDLVACMSGLIAGRRFACATALSCLAVSWSTVL